MSDKSLGTVIDEIVASLSALPDASRVIAVRTACEHLGIEFSGAGSLETSKRVQSDSSENQVNDGSRTMRESGAVIPTPSQVKVLMQKTGVTMEDLRRVVIFENGEVHFVQEPTTQKIARGQIEWALLLALKSGIETNNLSVDAEAVRSICQEKGFYDKGNFSKHFKAPSNSILFQGTIEPQGEAQRLSVDGQKELGKIIKELASAGS